MIFVCLQIEINEARNNATLTFIEGATICSKQTVLPVIVVTRPNFVHARAKSGE